MTKDARTKLHTDMMDFLHSSNFLGIQYLTDTVFASKAEGIKLVMSVCK